MFGEGFGEGLVDVFCEWDRLDDGEGGGSALSLDELHIVAVGGFGVPGIMLGGDEVEEAFDVAGIALAISRGDFLIIGQGFRMAAQDGQRVCSGAGFQAG